MDGKRLISQRIMDGKRLISHLQIVAGCLSSQIMAEGGACIPEARVYGWCVWLCNGLQLFHFSNSHLQSSEIHKNHLVFGKWIAFSFSQLY